MFTVENVSQRTTDELRRLAQEVHDMAASSSDENLHQDARDFLRSVGCIVACRERGEDDCEDCVHRLMPLKDRSDADRMAAILETGEWSGWGSEGLGPEGPFVNRQQRRAAERRWKKQGF